MNRSGITGLAARVVVATTISCGMAGCGGRRGPIEPARVTADQMRETQEAIARAQGSEAAAARQDIRPEATDGSR